MKIFVCCIVSYLAFNSYADYTPVVICGNRDLVLDIGYVSRAGQEAQLVLKNKEIIFYLISAGAINESEINKAGEYISQGIIDSFGNFEAGGYQLNMKGVTFEKRGSGYFLEIYVNNYPKYDSIANFYFKNCIIL